MEKTKLCGSSPRVWRTRFRVPRPIRVRRFIPACVGNSPSTPRIVSAMTVHPRVCGELRPCHAPLRTRYGSSPRVWGTQLVRPTLFPCTRFIPACVGNSLPVPLETDEDSVHPRVCGELPRQYRQHRRGNGSSPRVWGTLPHVGVCQVLDRFIPACVGNSAALASAHVAASVHPRVCGELPNINQALAFYAGSSPRVWGTPHRAISGYPTGRFIPACVGNSHRSVPIHRLYTVHPRVCGELKSKWNKNKHWNGSSPRVWGTLTSQDCSVHAGRFIPACVGNSQTKNTRNCKMPVHPRVCGELTYRVPV